ncbi:hypothetical protein [Nostoc sp. UHCC 0870]|uniref:hypothetical protein n=1 Tax=Nostoc sp. UHCC 0870 TaxID=2914041 RepID=UPI001EE0D5CD|nr:hypothetical protein [Nostoc sp. UHCC 0870]UKO97476.1 hypothetical protein L6494_23340 [Nostoc sp. UHCC 0870]
MLEKLFLAGILTFTLSLFAQVHRSTSIGMTQQINSYYKVALNLSDYPSRELKSQNIALKRKEGSSRFAPIQNSK